MKSSTIKKTKTKKHETPRLMTRAELNALTLHVYLYDEGWGVRDHSGIKSFHRTQAEAVEKGRAMAKKRSGQLAIHDRVGHVRKWEGYFSGPIRVELKPIPPDFRPINATRKVMREAMKAVVRERLAAEAQQRR